MPAGMLWAGLVKNPEPLDIPPEASPDCANAFFFDGTKGLLGPRFGKEYAGLGAKRIMGIFPLRGMAKVQVRQSNGSFVFGTAGFVVAYDDGSNEVIPSIGGGQAGAAILPNYTLVVTPTPPIIQANPTPWFLECRILNHGADTADLYGRWIKVTAAVGGAPRNLDGAAEIWKQVTNYAGSKYGFFAAVDPGLFNDDTAGTLTFTCTVNH
jgi:hypothetical protein